MALLQDSDLNGNVYVAQGQNGKVNSDHMPKVPEEYSEQEDEDLLKKPSSELSVQPSEPVAFKSEIVWTKAFFVCAIHGLAIYGLFNAHRVRLETFLFAFVIGILSAIGVQVGAHRLWSHRSFKASTGLRIFLMLCQTMAGQKSIEYWVRDHRIHHKHSETDADPHNSNRGFWFAHMGWIMIRKHPNVLKAGQKLNLQDIEEDQVAQFQKRYYVPLVVLTWGVFPAFVPVYFWGESLWWSTLACVFFRHVYILNITGLVNSWAHMFGDRPYDERIAPAECAFIRHLMMGEGFHNYHHAFPWDYSTSELGPIDVFNPATAFIDFCEYMGWAWDLKKASPKLIESKMKSHGVANFSYKERSLCEWISGALMVFMPWFLLRWVLRNTVG